MQNASTLHNAWPSTRPMLLIAEHGGPLRRSAARILQQYGARLAVARSAAEAQEMLSDLHFIGAEPDGLLTDAQLGDGSGLRVLRMFQRLCPQRPAGVLCDGTHPAAGLWATLEHVELLHKDALVPELQRWLRHFAGASTQRLNAARNKGA